MKKSIILPFLLLTTLLLSACKPAQPSTDTIDTAPADAMVKQEETIESDEAMEQEEASMTDDADFTLEMSMFKYVPNIIKAAPGETITVKIVSVDGLHDFVIDELNVKSQQLKSDTDSSEETFEVTIPADAEPGTEYEFYCSVGQHRANGMIGTLVVE